MLASAAWTVTETRSHWKQKHTRAFMMHYIRYYYHTCITTSWQDDEFMCCYAHIYIYILCSLQVCRNGMVSTGVVRFGKFLLRSSFFSYILQSCCCCCVVCCLLCVTASPSQKTDTHPHYDRTTDSCSSIFMRTW